MSLISRVIQLGVSQEHSQAEIRRVQTITFVAILALFFNAVISNSFLFLVDGSNRWSLLAVNSIFIAGYLSTLVVNARGHVDAAMWMVLMVGLGNIAVGSLVLGVDAGSALFFVLMPAVGVLATRHDDTRSQVFLMVAAVVGFLTIVVVVDPAAPESIAGKTVESVLLVGNFSSVVVFVTVITLYTRRRAHRAEAQSEALLHNILPDDVARRLKSDKRMIADDFESASVLFADVVDFTPMSAGMSPAALVGLLNTLFTTLDTFVEELGLEKIKTVGDEYMVAAGVPQERSDHAHAIAELALRIRDYADENQFDGHDISLRIGINSGPVVAGIVGTHKFAYDLWGDVVNTASRMESAGVAGSIQLTPATYELIRDKFVCEPRGLVSVKGKGDMNTYFLLSRNADAAIAT